MTGTGKRKTSPWKHTERDRGWMRRKAAADERAARLRTDVRAKPDKWAPEPTP